MRKRTLAVGLVVAVVLAGGGVMLASNMGFKLNYALQNATDQGGSPATGANTLSIPWNPQVGIGTSKALIDDIGSSQVANVQRYIENTDSFEVYTGRAGSPNLDFTLAKEAYFVVMNTSVNYIVVGSHDPTASTSLDNATTQGGSGSGANLFSMPYHHTASTSKQLIDDIGSSQVANVQRYITATDSYEVYTGRAGTPNLDYSLAPGEGYFVVMNTTVNYTPSHY